MMEQTRIAIVGAGIAGLVAARALQRAGFRPKLFDRMPQIGEVGAGLTLAPNATHALRSIGLGNLLETCAMQPERAGVRNWRTGELKVSLARGAEMLAKFGAPYCHVHRADLHGALVRAVLNADPEAITLNADFNGLQQSGSAVQIEFAASPPITADLVIGADGLRSAVRSALFGADQPRFTGYIAFRGLVPIERLPAELIDPPSCLSTGPDRSFAWYLIRGGQTVNFVALAQRRGWNQEGWSIPATVEEVLHEYAGWHERVRTIIGSAPPETLFKWALFDREPLTEWSRGRTTLMGDAAHPMLPFLGQGAGMAIEDGIVLARVLADARSIDEALRRYETARVARATWVMLKSCETALAYHADHAIDAPAPPHVTAESLGIWAYNPATVDV
ncbi:MAG: FAD-dependent monooxygenase [Steroidobacteraceae bacterium]